MTGAQTELSGRLNRSARMHSEFYWVFLEEARATNSSNLESRSFRTGDWFVFL